MRQTVFQGIDTNVDETDLKPVYAQNAGGIDLSIPGELKNENMGFAKQVSTGYGVAVTSILQIGEGTTMIHQNDLT